MSGHEPRVTVCCVAFEQAPFIEGALRAILDQRTDFPVEVIVHDDASTDGTARIIAEVDRRYPGRLITILQKENQVRLGRRPRPLCWSMARGRYLAFCDGDDLWTDPLKLQKQADLLEAHPEASGCFHWAETHEDGQFKGKVYGVMGDRTALTTVDLFNTICPVHISSLMVRRIPLVFPTWYGKVDSGDLAIMSMVSANGPLLCLPEAMSIYRKHPKSVTRSGAITGRFHRNRIRLMRALDAYHGRRFTVQAARVIAQHEAMLRAERKARIKSGLRRIWRWARSPLAPS